MTRSTRPPARQAGPRDAGAASARRMPIAAVLAIVGLLAVGFGTVSLLTGPQ